MFSTNVPSSFLGSLFGRGNLHLESNGRTLELKAIENPREVDAFLEHSKDPNLTLPSLAKLGVQKNISHWVEMKFENSENSPYKRFVPRMGEYRQMSVEQILHNYEEIIDLLQKSS
jgi:hypothetical protein